LMPRAGLSVKADAMSPPSFGPSPFGPGRAMAEPP
jgi:hypothetical protein